jgi:prolyl-tRNA editing enzyme YbaK/EbsC (Cys-tRNA(Pro) deacylase)
VTAPRIGTLTWLPASDQVELLAARTAAAIGDLRLTCFVAAIDPDLADTAAFCAAYQVPPEVSANCVVVAGRRGDVTTMAACMVLATGRADVNRFVRKHLGVRKISFAAMEDAVAQTQMEYGGITPVGLPADWPVLVDTAVAKTDWVVIGSGIRGSKILIPGSTLARLPAAEVVDLALR